MTLYTSIGKIIEKNRIALVGKSVSEDNTKFKTIEREKLLGYLYQE